MRATLESSLLHKDNTLADLADQNQRLDYALKVRRRTGQPSLPPPLARARPATPGCRW
jgi:hypothetical protein